MRKAICSAVAAAALITVTGCANQSTGASASASGSASTKADYGVAVKYIGGKAGKATGSLSPVTIGWVNEQGGSSSTPEATAAVTAAVKLINERLGGIDGHPLKVRSCFVKSSAEEGQACAQDMYNDANVRIVLTGATSLAAEPLHSVLGKKKPVLGSTPSGSSDLTAANAYYTGAGPFGT
ncbi:ABC transporter substrate-binding protein, partial [Streptomyces sp. NPDC006356]